jgi:hypothetical protein
MQKKIVKKAVKKAAAKGRLARRRVRVRDYDVLLAALHTFAAWDDGDEVTGRFDDPGGARFARAELAKVGIHGPPPSAPAKAPSP